LDLYKADEIVNVFQTAMLNVGKINPYLFVRKSELKGFSISEIAIALKLLVARKYLFSTDSPDEIANLKKVVGASDFCLSSIYIFKEDEEVDELESLDKDSVEFREKLHSLIGVDKNTSEFKKFLELETIESFLNYCQYIGKTDPLYWEKVYSHLGLHYHLYTPIGYEDLTEAYLKINKRLKNGTKIDVNQKPNNRRLNNIMFWIFLIIVAIVFYFIFRK